MGPRWRPCGRGRETTAWTCSKPRPRGRERRARVGRPRAAGRGGDTPSASCLPSSLGTRRLFVTIRGPQRVPNEAVTWPPTSRSSSSPARASRRSRTGPARLDTGRETLTAFGSELKAFYLTMSRYGAVAISEAPDHPLPPRSRLPRVPKAAPRDAVSTATCGKRGSWLTSCCVPRRPALADPRAPLARGPARRFSSTTSSTLPAPVCCSRVCGGSPIVSTRSSTTLAFPSWPSRSPTTTNQWSRSAP